MTWRRDNLPAGVVCHEIMTHIHFDSIDDSADILANPNRAAHGFRTYIDGEILGAVPMGG
jgi:hypothetical protein